MDDISGFDGTEMLNVTHVIMGKEYMLCNDDVRDSVYVVCCRDNKMSCCW